MLLPMPPVTSSRRRLYAVLGALVFAALTAVGVRHVSEDGPHLVSQTDGSAAGAVSAPGPGRYYTVTVGQVCMSKAGTARIRSIEPVDPHGGVKVTDFSVVAAGADAMGAFDGRLRDDPAYRGSKTVSDICTRGKAASDLYIEVLKPRAEDAWAHEYRITYETDGDTDSERIRFSFGVCEADLDSCDHDETWSH
jgi:hypothetical protein